MNRRVMDRNNLHQAAALGIEGSPVRKDRPALQTMDLRKLRHAVVLAFEGNFSRAAEKLHITPSALSQSIAKLEEELGLVLFDRSKSGASLSGAGKQFIGRIDKLLSDARGLASDMAQVSGAIYGDVRFGLRPNAAKIFLGELIREVANEAPRLQLKTAQAINEVLIEYLLFEELDFAICDMPARNLDERLTAKQIARFTVDFYVRDGHPLLDRARLTLDDLREFPNVTQAMSDDASSEFRSWLGLAEASEFPWMIQCDDYAYLMEAVLHGNAVLMAPHLAVASEVGTGQIRRIQPGNVKHPGEGCLYLVTLANRSLSPPAKRVVSRIEALIEGKMKGQAPHLRK